MADYIKPYYNYTYGAGEVKNRQIKFYRAGHGANSIQADVFVLAVNSYLSTVPGRLIKIHKTISGRTEKLLSDFGIKEQDAIIKSLRERQITVSNGKILPTGLETISQLDIYI